MKLIGDVAVISVEPLYNENLRFHAVRSLKMNCPDEPSVAGRSSFMTSHSGLSSEIRN